MTVKSVPQAIRDLARIHDDRRSLYGDDYLHIGEVLAGIFPRGLVLRTSVDFNRFALVTDLVTKVSRYGRCMAKGQGHPDSLDDLSVYAQLLQHYDAMVSEVSELAVQKPSDQEIPRESPQEAQEGPEEDEQGEQRPAPREAPQPPPAENQQGEPKQGEVKRFPSPQAMPRAAFTARVLTPVSGKVAMSKS
jgi:hypothetical protein